jgi:predicted DsbA family dithiol-disulfide isomerase
VLCRAARDAGLDTDALKQALHDGRHTAEVQADQALAHQLGVTGVPLMLLRRHGAPWEEAVPLHGAVPYDTLELAVRELLGPP